MVHRLHPVTTLALATVACVCLGCNKATTPADDPESYVVYSAVLPKAWTVQVAHAERYAILDQTDVVELKLTPRGESEKLMRGALQSYERLNGHKWKLQRRFATKLPYDLVATSAFNAEMQRASLKNVNAKLDSLYPGAHGVISLSAVGFNSAKTVAVVQMHWLCGWLCGGAETYVLEKKNGNWVPMRWQGETQIIRY